jgi:hypothetical protein
MVSKSFQILVLILITSSGLILTSFKGKGLAKEDGSFVYKGRVYKPGDTVFGFKKYIKLVVGDFDSPLLLGVPHDGVQIGDPEIPETGTTGRDLSTLPLATEIAFNFKKITEKRAWVIINAIGRKRVDPNTFPKDVDSRYLDVDARETYRSYHDLLLAARNKMSEVQKNGKGGLFLDLHGHAHTYQSPQPYMAVSGKMLQSKFIDQTELGYGLSNYAISQSDDYLNRIADSSSIAAIARVNPNIPFSEILRGENSFGTLLSRENIVAVPSASIKVLEADQDLFGVDLKGNAKRRPYFNGGYCTRKYGTTVLGSTVGFNDNISAIQAETPGITVRNNERIRAVAAKRFANAIAKFLNVWYKYDYPVN